MLDSLLVGSSEASLVSSLVASLVASKVSSKVSSKKVDIDDKSMLLLRRLVVVMVTSASDGDPVHLQLLRYFRSKSDRVFMIKIIHDTSVTLRHKF